MTWNTACPDWQARILAGRLPIRDDFPLFAEPAAKALRCFKRLRIPDAHGQPPFGDVCGEWLLRLIEVIFGALDPETQIRALQEIFVMVPKKNSKSTWAAGVAMTAIIVNERPRAEIIVIAPTKEIANITYGQADGMVGADHELTKLFARQSHIRTITHRRTGATIQVKAADTDVITGSKATVTIVDEIHEFARHHRAMQVFVELRGALAARPDGFLLQITTQSKEPPAGVFKAELTRARAVRDGKLSLPLLPVLYELPRAMQEADGWRDPANFRLVNPNLGRSVSEEFLRREMTAAEEEGNEKLRLFASQHLNIEIGIALSADRWAGAEFWEACAEPSLDLDALLARSEVVTVGIDGGGLDDLLGLAVVGREIGTGRWLVWCRAWAHRIVLDRRKSEAARLADFAKLDELVIVEDIGADVAELAEIVERIDAAGLLPGDMPGIGVDPAGISDVVEALAAVGIEGDRIIGVAQGWSLQGVVKTVERKLAAQLVAHGGQALMGWCVGNAKPEQKGNATLITKAAAGTAKVDPLFALFDAAAIMRKNPDSRSMTGGIVLIGGAPQPQGPRVPAWSPNNRATAA